MARLRLHGSPDTVHPQGDAPSGWSAKRPVVAFAARLALLLALFYGLTALPWVRHELFPRSLEITARLTAVILRGLGEQAQAAGPSISTPRFNLTIARGCDPSDAAILLIAAMLAFPAARMPARLAGAAVCVPLLFALNLVRIISLYYAGVWFPGAFQTLHVEIWQVLFIGMAMLMWMVWALRAARSRAATVSTTPHARDAHASR